MKIYLAGSVAGGREFENSLQLICDALEKLEHEVLTKNYVVIRNPKDAQAKTVDDRKEVVDRDMQAIRDADMIVMEVSQNSHGVGYEHRFAEELDKPILLLRHKSLEDQKFSAFIDGQNYEKQHLFFYDENNLDNILREFMEGINV